MRWKSIWCNARENIQPVSSPGKLLAGVMREKRIRPVSKRGKTFNVVPGARRRVRLKKSEGILMFRALVLRQSEPRNCGLCEVYQCVKRCSLTLGGNMAA